MVHWWLREGKPLSSVTCSINLAAKEWLSLFPQSVVSQWVREGVRVGVGAEMDSLLSPRFQEFNLFRSEAEESWAEVELERLCKLGSAAMYEPSLHGARLVLTPMLLAPKSGRKLFRLVMSSKRVNRLERQERFKLDGIKDFIFNLRQGWFFIKIDLKEAYTQLGLHLSARRFFAVMIKGKIYLMNVLPFGYSLAPWIFNKTMKCFIGYCRRNGLMMAWFFDDFILSGPSSEAVERQRDVFLLPLMKRLGLEWDLEKSRLTPVQREVVLGFILDTREGKLFIPESKVGQYQRLLWKVSVSNSMEARELASVIGKLISVSKAFTPSRVFTRGLLACLVQVYEAHDGWESLIVLSDEAKKEAKWLADNMRLLNGRRLWKPLQVVELATDASLVIGRWGATCLGEKAGGYFEKVLVEGRSINVREMYGTLFGLQAFLAMLRGKNVRLKVDSQVVWSYFEGMRSKVGLLGDIFVEVFLLCLREDISIVDVVWVPSKENAGPDQITRTEDWGDWITSPAVFRRAVDRWSMPSIDRFADPENRVVRRFNSWLYTPECEAADAFTQSWKGEMNWIVAPFNMVGRILSFLWEQQAEAIMLIPVWPAQVWWPLFMSLVVDEFKVAPSDFLPGHSGRIEPQKYGGAWKMVMAKLDGSRGPHQ